MPELTKVVTFRMKMKSASDNARIVYYFLIIVFALIFLRQSYEAILKFREMNTSFHVNLKVLFCTMALNYIR